MTKCPKCGKDYPTKRASLESIWNWRKPKDTILVDDRLSITEGNVEQRFSKSMVEVGTLGDLEKLGTELEIINLIRNEPSRHIKIQGDYVLVEYLYDDMEVVYPKSTIVYYEPWFMDRGSYMIRDKNSPNGWAKFAVEGDPVNVR